MFIIGIILLIGGLVFFLQAKSIRTSAEEIQNEGAKAEVLKKAGQRKKHAIVLLVFAAVNLVFPIILQSL